MFAPMAHLIRLKGYHEFFTDATMEQNLMGASMPYRTHPGAAKAIQDYNRDANIIRNLMQYGEFVEIFADTPLEVAEKHDVKGLYKRARAGEIIAWMRERGNA